MEVEESPQGTIIDIYVKPNSMQFQLQIENDEFLVYCRETPAKGKVNRELIKELSKLFKRKVEIVSGHRSRQKRVLIRDADAEEVIAVMTMRNQ